MRSVIIVIALSLSACGGGGSPEQTPPPIVTPTPPAPPETPLFSEALDCVDTPESSVVTGTSFKRVTLSGENAICNDGSQAIMFIQRAATVAGEQNWSINFQGGGGCIGEDCAARWCSGGDDRMTSSSAPNGSEFEGIFSQDQANLRPDANKVFLHYCSSDNFAGQRSDVIIAATDTVPEFRIHFQGANILNAAMDSLELGAVSDDGTVSLPPLGGSGLFTISGTSAGCGAVSKQGDRLATRAKGLGHTTQLICDGNFTPDIPFLPDDDRRDTVAAAIESAWSDRNENHDPLRDESCVELQTEAPWRCDVPSYVLANHITESPIFVRMDLGDPTISNNYINNGYTASEFASGVRDGLISASQGTGIEQPMAIPAIFAPACGRHVALFSTAGFFNTSISDDVGAVQTLNDALDLYAQGLPVTLIDTIPPSLSSCGN